MLLARYAFAAADSFSIKVSTFSSLEEALKTVDVLGGHQIKCDIEEVSETSYGVSCGPFTTWQGAEAARSEIDSLGYKDAYLQSTQNITPQEKTSAAPSRKIFGGGGYLHPFLSLTENYGDNVFYTQKDRKSDFWTSIVPGMWVALPGLKDVQPGVETQNRIPGGVALTTFNPAYHHAFQGYLKYQADIERYSKYASENDTTSQAVEGFLQYNLRGGLSLNLSDQLMNSYNPRGLTLSPELDKFVTNYFNPTISYQVSDKWLLRLEYINYLVHYTAASNDFRDRTDNSYSGYIIYGLTPRTSVFVQYQFIDIGYKNTALLSRKEKNVFAGGKWQITAKTTGIIKAGYSSDNFTVNNIGTKGNFTFEGQVVYDFTPKTSLSVKARRAPNETDIQTPQFIISDTVDAVYSQQLTYKLTGSLDLYYRDDRYINIVPFEGETQVEDAKYYGASADLRYAFRKWLQTVVGYAYEWRNANPSDFNYKTNILYLRIAAAF